MSKIYMKAKHTEIRYAKLATKNFLKVQLLKDVRLCIRKIPTTILEFTKSSKMQIRGESGLLGVRMSGRPSHEISCKYFKTTVLRQRHRKNYIFHEIFLYCFYWSIFKISFYIFPKSWHSADSYNIFKCASSVLIWIRRNLARSVTDESHGLRIWVLERRSTVSKTKVC